MPVHDEKNQPAEMIAVQVAEHHAVERIRIDALRFECGQRGGAAIEQHVAASGLDTEAGVGAAAGAERVARADDRQLHTRALKRDAICACRRRTSVNCWGSSSFAAFMKSIAASPVISATLKSSPVASARSPSSRS